MEGDILQFSGKYQVVIPKAARKTMGITDPSIHQLRVALVPKKCIYLEKVPTLDDFYQAYAGVFPKNANAQLRKMRDEEWE